MRQALLFCLVLLAIIGCQSKEYRKAEVPPVPPPTHQAPKNPIDTELVDWKPYSEKIDKTTALYHEYKKLFSRFATNAALKKRIVVVALDDMLKKTEDHLKLALAVSDNFVVMERGMEQYHQVLQQLSQKKAQECKQLTKLYSQYLLLLNNMNGQTQFMLYNLARHQLLKQGTVAGDNSVKLAESVLQEVSTEKWQGEIATNASVKDKQVIINAGSLDGVKKGDSFKVTTDKEGSAQEELLIEDVQDKYATARIMGSGNLSKGMKIEAVRS